MKGGKHHEGDAGPRPRGTIVTFYSYKGGTGRSMALANVAWILASQGKRVLAVDWDLEAPGLQRYFHPLLPDPSLVDSPGVIDFVREFAHAAMRESRPASPRTRREPEDAPWFHDLAELARFAVSLRMDWRAPGRASPFPAGGTVDFVGAGRQTPDYSARVNAFDWELFYDRLGGGAFLQVAAARMRDAYDYVLIDSRTGVSDTSGICTVELPDRLAVFFTLNSQSVEGAANVAESVFDQRLARGLDPIPVFPVMTRVDFTERDRLDAMRQRARTRFEPVTSETFGSVDSRERYWSGAEILYVPYYAYEEVLAPLVDRPGQSHTLLSTMEWLSGTLTLGETTACGPVDEATRQELHDLFVPDVGGVSTEAPRRDRWDFFLSYSSEDADRAAALYDALSRRARVFYDRAALTPGTTIALGLTEALEASTVMLFLVGDASSVRSPTELEVAVRPDRKVVPVYLQPDAADHTIHALQERVGVEAWHFGDDMDALADRLMDTLDGRATTRFREESATGAKSAASEPPKAGASARSLVTLVTLGVVAAVAVWYALASPPDGAHVDPLLVSRLESELEAARAEKDRTVEDLVSASQAAAEASQRADSVQGELDRVSAERQTLTEELEVKRQELEALSEASSSPLVWKPVEDMEPAEKGAVLIAYAALDVRPVSAEGTALDFSGATLTAAQLQGALLEGADLAGADLTRARLDGANLRGADLRGADLSGVDLRKADLDGALVDRETYERSGWRPKDVIRLCNKGVGVANSTACPRTTAAVRKALGLPSRDEVSSCEQFRAARSARVPDEVACNGSTADGYYWRVVSAPQDRLAGPGYFGFRADQPQPICGPDHVGDPGEVSRSGADRPWSAVQSTICYGFPDSCARLFRGQARSDFVAAYGEASGSQAWCWATGEGCRSGQKPTRGHCEEFTGRVRDELQKPSPSPAVIGCREPPGKRNAEGSHLPARGVSGDGGDPAAGVFRAICARQPE